MEVLTSGTKYDQEEARKDGKPIRSTVVTLAVTPVDAERIALAGSEGKIMLCACATRSIVSLLRPPASSMGEPDRQQRTRAASDRVRERPRAGPLRRPRQPQQPAPAIYTVEAIRAAKRHEEHGPANEYSQSSSSHVDLDRRRHSRRCDARLAAASSARRARRNRSRSFVQPHQWSANAVTRRVARHGGPLDGADDRFRRHPDRGHEPGRRRRRRRVSPARS